MSAGLLIRIVLMLFILLFYYCYYYYYHYYSVKYVRQFFVFCFVIGLDVGIKDDASWRCARSHRKVHCG